MQNISIIQIPFTTISFTPMQLITTIIVFLIALYILFIIVPTLLSFLFDSFRNENKPFKKLIFKEYGPTHRYTIVKIKRFSKNRIHQLLNTYQQDNEIPLRGGTIAKVSSIIEVHKNLIDKIVDWHTVTYKIVLEIK